MDVRIDEVAADVVITEGVGALSAEDVRRLVGLVLEQLRHERNRSSERAHDTEIHDRALPR
jgi:hypothetical protein